MRGCGSGGGLSGEGGGDLGFLGFDSTLFGSQDDGATPSVDVIEVYVHVNNVYLFPTSIGVDVQGHWSVEMRV